jgi:magnesium transporter
VDTARLLAKNFAEEHPSDAAWILEQLSPDTAVAYIEELPPRLGAAVVQRMAASTAAECISRLSPERFGQLMVALPLDRAAGLLRRLDAGQRELLLQHAPTDVATLLARLLRYPQNSAGSLMDPRVMALPDDITVSEALARVRRVPRHALYYLYVIDREQSLVGVLNLRELMLALPRDPLSAIMQREVSSLSALSDRAAIIDHPGWRNVHALPVIDDQGKFLGVLRYETLRQLEVESNAPTPATGALSTVLTLGELCWVGLAGVLTDLTTSVDALTKPTRKDREPTDG